MRQEFNLIPVPGLTVSVTAHDFGPDFTWAVQEVLGIDWGLLIPPDLEAIADEIWAQTKASCGPTNSLIHAIKDLRDRQKGMGLLEAKKVIEAARQRAGDDPQI